MPPSDDPDRLSEDDDRILRLESASIAGHTLKLLILEPGDGALTSGLRLPWPRGSTRPTRDPPGGHLRPGTTVGVAEAFDIRQHVRPHSDPQCDSKADLWRIVGGLMSEHLDRSRPLWTFDVIGPLADGREAIAARIHHAMADGIAGVRFLDSALFDARAAARDRAAGTAPGLHEAPRPTPLPKRSGCPAPCCANSAM